MAARIDRSEALKALNGRSRGLQLRRRIGIGEKGEMLKDGLFPCREQVDFRVGIGLATRNRARPTSRLDLNKSGHAFFETTQGT